MKKTYWWRVLIIIVTSSIIFLSYVVLCDFNSGRCFGGNSIPTTRFFVHISLSLLITSPFLFFVHDKTFLRWAKFAGIWFFLSGIFVYLSPEYQGGWLGIGPEKESVSILMGILFVIISLPLLFLSERREGKE